MLFEPEQTWLHEVIPLREKQTDIQCSNSAQRLGQLRIFPMFARAVYEIMLHIYYFR